MNLEAMLLQRPLTLQQPPMLQWNHTTPRPLPTVLQPHRTELQPHLTELHRHRTELHRHRTVANGDRNIVIARSHKALETLDIDPVIPHCKMCMYIYSIYLLGLTILYNVYAN